MSFHRPPPMGNMGFGFQGPPPMRGNSQLVLSPFNVAKLVSLAVGILLFLA